LTKTGTKEKQNQHNNPSISFSLLLSGMPAAQTVSVTQSCFILPMASLSPGKNKNNRTKAK
jgi:hypothetical protein